MYYKGITKRLLNFTDYWINRDFLKNHGKDYIQSSSSVHHVIKQRGSAIEKNPFLRGFLGVKYLPHWKKLKNLWFWKKSFLEKTHFCNLLTWNPPKNVRHNKFLTKAYTNKHISHAWHSFIRDRKVSLKLLTFKLGPFVDCGHSS